MFVDGFKATDQMAMEEKYENKRNRGSDVEEAVFPIKTTSMVFALQTIQGFKTFSHFCMGKLCLNTIKFDDYDGLLVR